MLTDILASIRWPRRPVRNACVVGLVVGLHLAGCSPPGEVNVVASVDEPETYVPAPWLELSRVSSPDGQIDAVIVSRPTEGPDTPEYPPTNLYLVPRGTVIPAETPIRPSFSKMSMTRLKRDAPFVGFKVKGISVKWKDDRSVLLDVHTGLIENHQDSKQVVLGDENTTVGIEYVFRNCYSGESPRSRRDLKPISALWDQEAEERMREKSESKK